MSGCIDHFDTNARRCSECTQIKSLPAEQEKWGEQWRKHSADNDFRARQQKLLDECSAQRVKEQTEEQIRISPKGPIIDARDQNEALAHAAALGRDAMKFQAVITEPFPH
eukprot:5258799-Pyramimonas_sp.AAC.1